MAFLAEDYPRDLRGYGGQPPHARWPNNARIAVQFVLNYEEGSENHVLHGDAGSEQFLSDIIGAAILTGICRWIRCMSTAAAPVSGASIMSSANGDCR